MEIINQQVGDNFNQRFERLVYNCYMLIPERERQLKGLDEQISQRRKDLEELRRRYAAASDLLHSLEYKLTDIERLFGLAEKP